MSIRRRFATTIRRLPFLMRLPYYAYRFIQPKYTVGVAGVVFNEQGEVLLVEHVFHPHCAWGLPGGWIDRNEDPDRAIVRELHEELALVVQPPRLVSTQRTSFNHLDIAYLCQKTNDVGAVSYELFGYRWVALDELPRLKRFHYQAIMQASKLLISE